MSSSDKEQDYLEDLFLKCDIKDIPIPKTDEIGPYENEVLEVMKSGCNRQIAEYVIMEYKKQEDKDKKEVDNFVPLDKLYESYNNIIKKYIEDAQFDLKNNKGGVNNFDENMDKDLEGFENEIESVMSCIEEENENNQDKDKKENLAKYYLHLRLFKDNNNKEEIKKIKLLNKQYYDKRDAVIESALRKVKKIVNDDNEFKIFYKDYYGKDYQEDEE
jgi:hypothetical protein